MADEPDAVPLQFAQFFNDVVVVTYNDGTSLQLSACGNQFVHLTPPSVKNSGLSAPAGFFRVQQKSEFATSAFRGKVREALQFRNMFASRPFVCHLLMDEHSTTDTLKDAVEPGGAVEWPKEPAAVEVADNGRLVLQAVRPASCVVHLASNRQEFRSEFAVRLPPSRLKDGASLAAVRVTGHHSLRLVPECWRPAVNLILRSIGVPPDSSSSSSSPLPEPLPLRCQKQHLHKFERAGPPLPEESAASSDLGWLVCAEGRRLVKALCLEGVLYRLHPPPHLTVEIYPGDGSILVSNNLTGCFFTHFLPSFLLDELNPSEKDLEVVERVYSTSAPPPSCAKKADYNLGRVLARGRLLCEYLAECLTILGTGDALTTPADCCWRASEEEEALEAEVGRALSRLSARSSDRGGIGGANNGVNNGAKDSHRSSGSDSRRSGRSARSESRREERSSGRRSEEKIVEENGKEEDIEEENSLTSRRLLEKNEVHDVGTFTAAASGRIQILFRDRVSLDMRADLSRRLKLDGRQPPLGRFDPCPDLPPAGYARIFTRDGRFEVTSVQQPEPEFERYINSALEWIDWVNSSPDERARFYTERPQPPCAQTELKKIECFNYILENSGQTYAPVKEEPGANGDPYDCTYISRTNQIKSIEDTLAKTSKFLKDLDSLRSKRKL